MLPVLVGCSSFPQAKADAPIRLPTAPEVQDYVSANWPEFQARFGRLANRVGEHPALVSVGEVTCSQYLNYVAECAYTITARYAQTDDVSRQLQSQFERHPDGSLHEVIVMLHERKRP
jgi:hypothetical protein